jgi:hypothetical protein
LKKASSFPLNRSLDRVLWHLKKTPVLQTRYCNPDIGIHTSASFVSPFIEIAAPATIPNIAISVVLQASGQVAPNEA